MTVCPPSPSLCPPISHLLGPLLEKLPLVALGLALPEFLQCLLEGLILLLGALLAALPCRPPGARASAAGQARGADGRVVLIGGGVYGQLAVLLRHERADRSTACNLQVGFQVLTHSARVVEGALGELTHLAQSPGVQPLEPLPLLLAQVALLVLIPAILGSSWSVTLSRFSDIHEVDLSHHPQRTSPTRLSG